MDIDSETSEALYEKLLQLESEVRKKLKAKQKDSQLVHSRLSWYSSGIFDSTVTALHELQIKAENKTTVTFTA